MYRESRRSKRPGLTNLLMRACIVCFSNLPLTRSKTMLDPVGIYGSIAHAQECLSIAWNTASVEMKGPTVPNCLRFAFHDAGTYQNETDEGGANGSIMNELDFTMFPQNNGLNFCGDAMKVILETARTSGCPELTAADAVQVAGAAAVALRGGPVCDLLMGRPDVDTTDDTSVLPMECDNAASQVANFARQGFTDPVTAVVTLSGAHSIGFAHVTKNSPCSRGIGTLTQSSAFDNHYYDEIIYGRKTLAGVRKNEKGWFASDTALQDPGTATRALMIQYADNHSAFISAWCPQYREMSLVGVDPGAFSIEDGWTPNAPNTPTEFSCKLQKANGVSDVKGKGYVEMKKDGDTWKLILEVKKMKGMTAAHLHEGKSGNNGPVVLTPLPGNPDAILSGDFELRYTFSNSLLDGDVLRDGGYYLNILTDKYDAGALRCQLSPKSS